MEKEKKEAGQVMGYLDTNYDNVKIQCKQWLRRLWQNADKKAFVLPLVVTSDYAQKGGKKSLTFQDFLGAFYPFYSQQLEKGVKWAWKLVDSANEDAKDLPSSDYAFAESNLIKVYRAGANFEPYFLENAPRSVFKQLPSSQRGKSARTQGEKSAQKSGEQTQASASNAPENGQNAEGKAIDGDIITELTAEIEKLAVNYGKFENEKMSKFVVKIGELLEKYAISKK